MKVKRRKSKKYPTLAITSDGKKLIIPRQSRFSNPWLRKHGCSLMAEYIALQFLGVKKIRLKDDTVGIYPINLLKWHKKHTKSQVKKKVTVRGVAKGINELAKGKGKAKYYKTVTADRIKDALKDGHLVIMEQKDPIHTIVLVADDDGNYILNHGKAKKVLISKIAKTATNNNTYRGMIVVKKEE